jgi:hypothetical protein
MRLLRFLIAVGLSLAATSSAFADEEMCRRLRAFEQAPFERGADGKAQLRFVEVHWVGCWMDYDHGFGSNCQHSPDQAARELCAWLPDHTPLEFQTILPRGILKCHGLEEGDWFPWLGRLSRLKSPADDRRLLFEIDFQNRNRCHHALRLRIVPDGAVQNLPPMIDSKVDPVVGGNPALGDWPDH